MLLTRPLPRTATSKEAKPTYREQSPGSQAARTMVCVQPFPAGGAQAPGRGQLSPLAPLFGVRPFLHAAVPDSITSSLSEKPTFVAVEKARLVLSYLRWAQRALNVGYCFGDLLL